jgi:hypothetical protein
MQKIHVSAAMILAAMLGATTVPAHAQSARPLQFGLNVGTSVPTGAFGDRAKTGATFGGDVAYRLGRTPFALQGDVAYAQSGLTNQFLDRFSGLDDGNASVLSGTLDLTARLPHVLRLQPYVLGGGGVYRRHVKVDRVVGEDVVTGFDPYFGFYEDVVTDETTVRSRTQTKFGLNGGGGVMIPVAGVHTFIEARYHDAFTDKRHTGYVPITFGIQF